MQDWMASLVNLELPFEKETTPILSELSRKQEWMPSNSLLIPISLWYQSWTEARGENHRRVHPSVTASTYQLQPARLLHNPIRFHALGMHSGKEEDAETLHEFATTTDEYHGLHPWATFQLKTFTSLVGGRKNAYDR